MSPIKQSPFKQFCIKQLFVENLFRKKIVPCFFIILFSFVSFFSFLNIANAQTHKGINLQMYVQDSAGAYPTQAGVNINAKIFSVNNCILLEENINSVNIDTGYFSVNVGTGARGGVDPHFTLNQAISNIGTKSGLTCLDTSGAVNGAVTSYTPMSQDVRTIRLSFTVSGQNLVVDFPMRATGYAVEAESVSGSFLGDVTGTQSATTVSKIQGNSVSSIAPTSGQVLTWNSVSNSWEPTTIASGSPSSISGAVPINTTSPITTTGVITGQTVSATTVNSHAVNLYNAGNTNFIGLAAPASLASNFVLTMPGTTGSAGQMLVTDGIGNLSWINPSAAAPVTSVAGRTGVVTLTNADISGLGNSATLNVGTTVNTVASGNDARITGALQTGAIAAGDLSGSLPNPTVSKIQGVSVSVTAPIANQVLQYNGTQYVPANLPSAPVSSVAGRVGAVTLSNTDISGLGAAALLNVGTTAGTVASGNDSRFTDSRAPNGAAAGDLSGTYPNPVVGKIQGVSVSSTAPVANQVLQYNGTQYVPANLPADAVTSVAGRIGAITLSNTDISGLGTAALLNVGTTAGTVASGNDSRITGALQSSVFNGYVSAASCSNTQSMYWNSVSSTFSCQNIGSVGSAGNFTGSLSGDVTGNQGTTVVGKIQGVSVSSTAPVANQVLQYNGTQYVPANLPVAPVSSVAGRTGVVTLTNADISGLGNSATLNVGTTVNTVASGNDARITGALQTGAIAAGDLSGSLPNPTVSKIQGVSVSVTAPIANQVLQYNGTQYVPANLPSAPVSSVAGRVGAVTLSNTDISGLGAAALLNVGTTAGTVASGNDSRFTDSRAPNGAAAGDLSGTYPNPVVGKIQGVSVSSTAPVANQVLQYNGTQYVPANLPADAVTSVAGRIGAITLSNTDISGLGTAALLNVGTTAGTVASGNDSRITGALQSSVFNGYVSAASCSNTQSMYWNSVSSTFSCQNIGSVGSAGNFTGSLSGDVTGNQGTTVVGKIQGVSVSSTAPVANQVLQYNGTQYVPANLPVAPVSSVAGRTGVVTLTNADISGLGNSATLNVGTTVNTVASGNDARITGALQTGAIAAGDLSGSLPNPTVSKIQGVSVSVTAPIANQVLQYNGTQYVPANLPSAPVSSVAGRVGAVTLSNTDISGLGAAALLNVGTTAGTVASGNDSRFTDSRAPNGAAAGDLSGTYPNPVVGKIQGVSVSSTAPVANQVLQYNGTQYVPANLPADAVTSVAGRIGAITLSNTDISGLGTAALLNVGTTAGTVASGNDSRITGALQSSVFNGYVSAASCSNTQSMYWNSVSSTFSCQNIGSVGSAGNFTGSLSGDVTGNQGTTVVGKIQGVSVSSTAPVANQVLQYNGTQYVPANLPVAPVSSVAGRTGVVTLTNADISGLGNSATLNVGTTVNTVASGNDARITGALQTGAIAAGDLSGSLPNPTVSKIQGVSVSVTAPIANQVLQYNGTQYVPANLPSAPVSSVAGRVGAVTLSNTDISGLGAAALLNVGTTAGTVASGNDSRFTDSRAPNGAAAGDLSGTYPNPVVGKIQGVSVSSTAPVANQVLQYNGTQYVPANLPADAVTSVAGRIGAITLSNTDISGLGTAALLNVGTTAGTVASGNDSRITGALQSSVFNGYVSAASCSNTQSMYWNSVSSTFSCQNIGSVGSAGNFTGSLSGDVTGNQGTTVVGKIQGVSVSSTAPVANQVLQYNGTQYVPANLPVAPVSSVAGRTGVVTLTNADISGLGNSATLNVGTTVNTVASGNDARITGALQTGAIAAGDLSGSLPNPTVSKIQGVSVSVTAPIANQVLQYNGTQYVPANLPSAPVSSVAGRVGAVTLSNTDISGLGAAALLNVGTTAGTVASGNDSRFTDSRAPNGAAAGDLSGTYPNPVVGKIQGVSVSSTAPVANQVLQYNGTQYVPANLPADAVTSVAGRIGAITLSNTDISGLGTAALLNVGTTAGTVASGNDSRITGALQSSVFNGYVSAASCSNTQSMYWNSVSSTFSCQNIGSVGSAGNFTGSLSGDVTGNQGTTVVGKIQGVSVSSTAPVANQVLQYNGTQYVPANLPVAPVSSVAGRTGVVTLTNADISGLGNSATLNVGTVVNTIAAGNDARITGALQSSVFNGYVSAASCSNTQSMYWNSVSSTFSCQNIGTVTNAVTAVGFSGALTGDVTGTQGSTTVAKLQGRTMASTAPTAGQVLTWNNVTTQWEPATSASAPVTSVAGRTGVITLTNADISGLGAAATMAVGTTAGTVAAGNDTRFTDARAPNGAAAGDLSGTYPSPVVGKLQGKAVSSTAPTAGQVLTWNNLTTQWEPATSASAPVTSVAGRTGVITLSNTDISGLGAAATMAVGTTAGTVAAGNDTRFTDARAPNGAAAGDLSGTYPSPVVGKLQGKAVSSTAPTAGQVLTWNNTTTQWEPTTSTAMLQATFNGYVASANCTNVQSMYWNSVSSTFACQAIGTVPTATSATNFSGSLAGDVTGTQAATVVGKIQGRAVASTAPTNGQTMVYNSTTSQWEPTNQSGAFDPGNYYSSVETFNTGAVTATTVAGTLFTASQNWVVNLNGAGTGLTPNISDTTPGTIGVVQLATGTTAIGYTTINQSQGSVLLGAGQVTYVIRAKLNQLSSAASGFNFIAGLHDSPILATAVDGVYLNYSHTAPAGLALTTISSSTATTTLSSFVMDTNYHTYKIVINKAGTSATLYVDGSSVATNSTNIPIGAGRQTGGPLVQIRSTIGTTTKTVNIDTIGLEFDNR